MANEIKIRAKKISDLNQDANFDFETKGDETYLIVAYKPTAETGGTASNFRISIKSIIDKLKDSISTKSVLEWAREHGFTGTDAELWQIFQNGSGTTPTDPTDPTDPTTDTTNYLFSYASEELQEGIFNKDANDTIIGINVTSLKALSWTQEVTGKVPTTNKNGHGFCLQDYNTTYSESYVWDDAITNNGTVWSRIWIILPAKFYNISQKNFIDEKGGKWKFVDPMMKNPMNPAVDPITITGLYEVQDYVLVCFSEEGNVDEQFFKKIG